MKQKTLEERVVAALREGPKSNKELRTALGMDPEAYDSQLDRLLQSKRKEGEFHLVNKRWALASFSKCPTCGGKGWVHASPSNPPERDSK